MKIPHVVNTTGDILNRYKMQVEGETEKTDIRLEFNPSDDAVRGTPFNETTMNPMIDEVNNSMKSKVEISELDVPGLTPIQLSEPQYWDDDGEYLYYIEVPVVGALNSMKIQNIITKTSFDEIWSGRYTVKGTNATDGSIVFYINSSDLVTTKFYNVELYASDKEE